MGTVFRIVKDLANVEDTQRRFGCRTEHHPEEIAEEWKQHFQAIQLGKITVPEEFWQDILPLATEATWLNDVPTPEEIQKAINDMGLWTRTRGRHVYGRIPKTSGSDTIQ